MRKRLLMATVLFLSAGTLAMGAAVGKIAGRIVDGATGAPLIGANVMVEGTMLGAAADDNGDYFILNVPPGQYALRAQMIGYSTVVTPEVHVMIDLTTTVDFEPNVETIAGEEVVVIAQRMIVQPDVSGSELNIATEEIVAGKFQHVKNLITAQVGVNSISPYEDQPEIRGSGIGESLFIVDGFSQVDPLTNRPAYKVNLDAVQEMKMATGGFLARYGNMRSGVITVVTKEGGASFHGSANIQYSSPGLKHFGPMMFGHQSPMVTPFVDPDAGAFTGVDKDGNENTFFEGWNTVAAERLEAGDAHYGKPGEVYARYLWRHRSDDSIEKLKRLAAGETVDGVTADIEWGEGVVPEEENWHQYGIEPDIKASFTLGGPIPLLPRTSFFVSYEQNDREYSFRDPMLMHEESMMRGKLTTWLGQAIKINVHAFWAQETGTSGGQGPGIDGRISYNPFSALGSENKFWYRNCGVTGQQTRQIYGIDLTHTLSPRTFYEVRFSHHRSDYDMLRDLRNSAPMPGTISTEGKPVWAGRYGEDYPDGLPTSGVAAGVIQGNIGNQAYIDSMITIGADGWTDWEKWAKVKIGDYWYDESPKGYGPVNWRDITGEFRMESCNLRNNDTYSRTYDFAASLTSQVNINHQVEAGVEFRADQVYQLYEQIDPSVNSGSLYLSDISETRGGAYLMDKLEYKGFIANLGLRADWLTSGDYPMLDLEAIDDEVSGPYSDYIMPGATLSDEPETEYGDRGYYLFNTYDKIPLKSVTQVVLSPRLGVSHPISDVAKIFFNYGHMYQWPSAYHRYQIRYNSKGGNRIDRFGNPDLAPPRTIAYEIGYEHNLFNMMSLRMMGYYKDINNTASEVRYTPIGHGDNIRFRINQGFRDTRGLEAILELRRGVVPFISGWASYNYLVESSGNFGFDRYYEDPSKMSRQVSSQVSNPDVRPIIKLSIDFHTPADFGPGLAGFSLLGGADLNLTYYWQRGEHFTWNPADIPLVEDNLRWTGLQYCDLRLTKDLFRAGSFRSVLYIDVSNVFNNKNMTHPRNIAGDNEGRDSRGNSVVSTDDDWAWNGHRWWKNQVQNYLFSLGYTAANQVEGKEGEFKSTKGDPGDWDVEGVVLPGFTPWTFLYSRDIFFGIRFYF